MKYAYITGAAGGLAGACVEELNRRGGWTIFAVDYNMEGLNALVERTSKDVIPIQIDISSMESVDAATEDLEYRRLEPADKEPGVCTAIRVEQICHDRNGWFQQLQLPSGKHASWS